MRDREETKRLAAEASKRAQGIDKSPEILAAFEQGWIAGCEHGRWEEGDAQRQVEAAHHALDMMGVSPKTPGGDTLTVRGRLDVLRGLA